MPTFVNATILLALTICGTTSASAQGTFPTKPIRFLLPYQAGGVADTLARRLDNAVTQKLGQPFIIESKPGGAGAVALETLRQAPPDGYTVFLGSAELSMLPFLKRSFNFDTTNDFANIAPFASFSTILALNKDFPAKTLPELIAYAKANPGKVRFGSGGVGSALHLVVELLNKSAGIELLHVPYKGGSGALTDALAGHIEMASLGLPNAQQAQAAGLRIIAQTGTTRSPLLPDVPTTAELGFPQVQMRMWFSIMAPRGTPDEVVQIMSRAIKEATESPTYGEQLAQIGTESFWLPPHELRELMVADRNKFSRAIADAGIEKVD